ncbi:beta-lactamase hydrolase domain-containing protein [Parahaliea mediterranea]|uniref:beta-lactamase hydrolase domain-containing protein n=1 Tax=Parahaliea mediterranea TaxID=651086 RepID=UPI000E2F3609|nr:sulfur transferase domain-containing protein [Parahaliea mediterranea]
MFKHFSTATGNWRATALVAAGLAVCLSAPGALAADETAGHSTAEATTDSKAHSTTLAPPASAVSEQVVNYHPLRPLIATAGTLQAGGVEELAALGFRTIIDLRTPPEGTASETAAVERAGLRYVNLPQGGAWPGSNDVAQFQRLLEEAEPPVMVHCASGNRVGALWAALRLKQGADLDTVRSEAYAIGLKPARDSQLRDYAAGLESPSNTAPASQ